MSNVNNGTVQSCKGFTGADPTFMGSSYVQPLGPPAAPWVPAFSPANSSGSLTFTLSYSVQYSTALVSITFLDSSDNAVRALRSNDPELQGAQSAVWDGQNDQGSLLPDGLYGYLIVEQNSAAPNDITTIKGSVAIEDSPPQAAITGFREDAADPFITDVLGTASDPYLSWYALSISTETGGSPATIASFKFSVASGTLGGGTFWNLPPGTYPVQLTAQNAAGLEATVSSLYTVPGGGAGVRVLVGSATQTMGAVTTQSVQNEGEDTIPEIKQLMESLHKEADSMNLHLASLTPLRTQI